MLARLAVLSMLVACSSKAAEPAAGSAGSAASAAPAAGSAAGFTRREIDCAGVISGSERAIGGPIAPGWGTIPKDLQLLPPGAELCGNGAVNGNQTAFIRSPLFGQALADFYAPAATGCAMKVDVNGNDTVQISMAAMDCGKTRRMIAVTDSTYGFYSMQVY